MSKLLPIYPLVGALTESDTKNTTALIWQDVHQLLSSPQVVSNNATLPDLFGYTIYHYCVYKAFRQEQHAAFAQSLFDNLIIHLKQLSDDSKQDGWLDQACMLAWLNAEFNQCGLASEQVGLLLVTLDHQLQEEALQLLRYQDAVNRNKLFKIVRYHSLRLPIATAESWLRSLLFSQLGPFVITSLASNRFAQVPKITQLGLTDGLALELLLFIKLCRMGLRGAVMEQSIRKSILHLLTTRRDINFQEQKYSIFPYQIDSQSSHASFTAELSWRRGDIGQSLLLYQAYELLQDEELAKIAELVGLNTLLRTTVSTTGIEPV